MLDGFFPNADLAFGILGTELWSRHGAALGWKAVRRLGRDGARDFAGQLLTSARDWLEATFASPRTHGVLAPWVLHTGLGPEAAGSGYMAQVIAVAVQEGGMPIPRGGGAKLADALVSYIRAQGGTCETGVHVERVSSGGVRTADGRKLTRRPRGDLQRHADAALHASCSTACSTGREGFRYGRSEMQIHFALSEPPKWEGDERLGQDGDRPSDARPRRRLTGGERGRARAAARGGDGRRRAAADDGRVACAGGEGPAVDPAAGAAVARQGRRRGRARRRRRDLDRGAAGTLRRPHPGASRAAHPEPGVVDPRPHVPVACRPAGREREPRARRSVRRLARARPELPLAGAAPDARSRTCGTSAPRPTRAPGWAAARERSWRLSCSRSRWRSALPRGSSAELAARPSSASESASQRRKPPRNASSLFPRLAFGGNSSSSLTPPPPITT